jgi:hypothetical protein
MPKILDKFDLVVPISECRAKNLRLVDYINNPVKLMPPLSALIDRDLDFVMINANKFSANKKSNYGLRRKYSQIMYSYSMNYELHGLDWKMNKRKEIRERLWALRRELKSGNFPSLREAFSDFFYTYPEYSGSPKDKRDILARSKFAIVIENESDYVSEKILDALMHGCVPIYVGPNLNQNIKLSECVIQLDGTTEGLINFLNSPFKDIYLRKKIKVDELRQNTEFWKSFGIEFNINNLLTIVTKKFNL